MDLLCLCVCAWFALLRAQTTEENGERRSLKKKKLFFFSLVFVRIRVGWMNDWMR
jgi:hypothetical protein